MAEATPEGVALTKVEINALSPDVIAAVLKRIVDDVMKLVPEGAFEKIAKEVIASGRICTKQKDHWGDWKEKDYLVLSDLAREEMAKRMRPLVERQVEAYFQTAEIQQCIAESVQQGVAVAIDQIPALAGKMAATRICQGIMHPTVDILEGLEPRVDHTRWSVQQAQKALVEKGVLLPNEAPLSSG